MRGLRGSAYTETQSPLQDCVCLCVCLRRRFCTPNHQLLDTFVFNWDTHTPSSTLHNIMSVFLITQYRAFNLLLFNLYSASLIIISTVVYLFTVIYCNLHIIIIIIVMAGIISLFKSTFYFVLFVVVVCCGYCLGDFLSIKMFSVIL